MFVNLVLIFILFNCKLLPVNTWNIPIPGRNHDSTRDISALVAKILWKCYSDNKEVVIHGDSDQLAIQSLRQSESLAVIIFNDAELVDNPVMLRLHRNSFVMTPRSISQLAKMLQTFKNSVRWNVMAPYFIMDKSDRQCKNARKMLKTAWQMNLIESYFLCVDSQSVPMVYTYNPYSNRAPQTWKEVQNTAKQSDGWTMYAQSHPDRNICESMTFDRTKHLDGSVIRLAARTWDPETVAPNKDYTEKIIPKLFDDVREIAENLKYSFNATLIFTIGSKDPMFESVKNGTNDILMLLTVADDRITYPVCYVRHHIVTNNRGFYSPIENIMNYYGTVTLVAMCVILPITFIIILLSERRGWSFAGFEILRLLINAALHTRLDRMALRIFFSVIFLYFLIIHATFQGHIVSFLMKQEYRKNVETLTDLRSSRYDEIHLKWTLESSISDPILLKKLILDEDSEDCISNIIGNTSVACICDPDSFRKPAFKHKLHVSQKPVFISPNYHRVRDDWPLQDRFNIFLMWSASTGQSVQDFEDRADSKIMERHKRIAAMAELEEIRPISMTMLNWIFIFLIIGLKVALMSFTVERRIRPATTRQMENERAARLNMENRRRQIINQIISDHTLVPDSRPRSV